MIINSLNFKVQMRIHFSKEAEPGGGWGEEGGEGRIGGSFSDGFKMKSDLAFRICREGEGSLIFISWDLQAMVF